MFCRSFVCPFVLLILAIVFMSFFDYGFRLPIWYSKSSIYTGCFDLRRAWRYQSGNQNPYIEEQTTQWPKDKIQNDLIWFDLLCSTPFSAISLWPVLVVEEAGENHRPWASNFIICGFESNAPYFVIYKAGREHMPYWW